MIDPGDHDDTTTQPRNDPESSDLRAILTNLGREIGQPLDLLRGGIARLLLDRAGDITEAEKLQAETMITLCDDLGRLTRDCLGGDGPSRD